MDRRNILKKDKKHKINPLEVGIITGVVSGTLVGLIFLFTDFLAEPSMYAKANAIVKIMLVVIFLLMLLTMFLLYLDTKANEKRYRYMALAIMGIGIFLFVSLFVGSIIQSKGQTTNYPIPDQICKNIGYNFALPVEQDNETIGFNCCKSAPSDYMICDKTFVKKNGR